MRLVRAVGIVLLFLSLAVPAALAQHDGRGQGDKQKRNSQAQGKEQSQGARVPLLPPPPGLRKLPAPPVVTGQQGQRAQSQRVLPRPPLPAPGKLPPPPALNGQPGQGARTQRVLPRPPLPGRAKLPPPPVTAARRGPQPVQRAVPRPAAPAPYSRPLRTEQQARDWQQRRGWTARGSWQAHATWQEHRAQHWQLEHRTWTQRGGYGGFFVPVERFRLFFGLQHPFRLYTRPVIVEGYPRFYYGGYWWMMVDPWPEFWEDTWYGADDLYIDYSDGYYLHSRRHPGVSLAISVAF